MALDGRLQGRKILLISPRFFGYEKRILDRLRLHGALATHVDDRPHDSTLMKALIRLCPGVVASRLDTFHKANLERLKGQTFDDLLFIAPEGCRLSHVQQYKAAFPMARTLLYMWDSFENKSHGDVTGFLEQFDVAASFDRVDCQTYGMRFRPLFFNEQKVEQGKHLQYDFSFIGTIHCERYAILRSLVAQAENRYTHFVFAYLPSMLHYYWFKLTKPEFQGVPKSAFHFSAMPYAEVLRVISESKAIVDIEHPRQRGLTMRTLEVIGAGKKLITTNREVLEYPFYSPGRVALLDRTAPALPEGFLEAELPLLPPELLATYSLDGWIEELLFPEP